MTGESLPYIVMMLIEAFDDAIVEKIIFHMSIPIVDWDIISYLIENDTVARMLHNRVKNRHTDELCRRRGLDIPIPQKEIFKISSTIRGQTSTVGLKSMKSIISSGYLDAFKVLIGKAESISSTQLMTLINTSLAMLLDTDVPINPCIIRWLLSHEQYDKCIPREITDMYRLANVLKRRKEHIMMRISMDEPFTVNTLIPVHLYHRLGARILKCTVEKTEASMRYIEMCNDAKRGFTPNIRVIDAIVRNCQVTRVRDLAIDNGWYPYIQ